MENTIQNQQVSVAAGVETIEVLTIRQLFFRLATVAVVTLAASVVTAGLVQMIGVFFYDIDNRDIFVTLINSFDFIAPVMVLVGFLGVLAGLIEACWKTWTHSALSHSKEFVFLKYTSSVTLGLLVLWLLLAFAEAFHLVHASALLTFIFLAALIAVPLGSLFSIAFLMPLVLEQRKRFYYVYLPALILLIEFAWIWIAIGLMQQSLVTY